MQKKESELILKAQTLIDSVKGNPLSLDDRIERAIALAGLMLEEAHRIQTPAEKEQEKQLAGMMRDPIGKVFTTTLTDQCFRSHRPGRVADQLAHVINRLGIPRYLPLTQRLALQALAAFGKAFLIISVPLTIQMIRKQTQNVILPGEKKALAEHMQKRRQEGVRINLNHLGEAILGEEEAKRRLQIYLDDLAKPEVEYISVKISTIYSQINLLAWHETLQILSERLKQLFRSAMTHRYIRADGSSVSKFVNLDMEEYKDLHLTIALFRQVLDEPEFYQHEAGIVLQSYLPDSFLLQQELTIWAMQRHIQGGAPIKIRIVKGANLAMEQFESALRLWPQAPFSCKAEVDANFKRMVTYGCQKEHAETVHLGIGSHNLFDIAYALLLRVENQVEQFISFEMLEGMADHMRRVVQQLSGDMLLYCPSAAKDEFQNAVAYLVRRLDENTAPENFLRHAFDLKSGSKEWKEQAERFAEACKTTGQIHFNPNRIQNREMESCILQTRMGFENEPDTDWSLPQNRRWAEKILNTWKSKAHPPIPLVIGGEIILPQKPEGIGEDPSYPGKSLYHYALATEVQIDQALEHAKQAEKTWSQTSVDERMDLLAKIAQELRRQRADLIGAMVADTGKTVVEGDVEVSEAIDFAEFYRFNLKAWHSLQDIEWKAKGTILVAPPWNFPCSIPTGGILAALAAGNCVLFKPAPESVLTGWHLAQIFWKAGVSRQVLQFIACEDDPVGSLLIQDPRLSAVVLTGATSTAKLFLKKRPGLDLMAETGGKNTLVISSLSDRDLAIKDLLQSAFGHAGQKCSACSLAILEAEVYDDPHFLQQLRDAAASLTVGSPWDFKTKINPLIRPPNETLMRGLTQLEQGEKWLLEPNQNSDNPQLWSPGIKLGVKPSSFTFQQELFGPVLGLVRAENMQQAYELMNQTPYGLTAGIHSLDDREQQAWLSSIEAGNCYINRTITGAIVDRQPFGGVKESSFGRGLKAGGPNYLVQFMEPSQSALPAGQSEPNDTVKQLTKSIEKFPFFDLSKWKASIGSYAYFWKEYFSKLHDPSLVRGQDNFIHYVPRRDLILRGQKGDSLFDLLCFIAAALTCGTKIEVSCEDEAVFNQLKSLEILKCIPIRCETNEKFAESLSKGKIKRIRLLQLPSQELLIPLAQAACRLHVSPVLSNGRLELLHLLREVSISRDYHRYGHLGIRENEKRSPLPGVCQKNQCQGCPCHE